MDNYLLRRQSTFTNRKVVRTLSILIFGLAITLLGPGRSSSSQSVGKEGNRVVGVIFHENGTAAGDARVGVFHREETLSDHANADGLFYITIPKDVTKFQLVSRAPGCWVGLSPELSSTTDPIKADRITLHKKNARSKAQLEMVDLLLQNELAVYRGTSSAATRKAMRDELIKFSESIEIPAWDPTLGITMQEREMRIRARISVDTTVVKMK